MSLGPIDFEKAKLGHKLKGSFRGNPHCRFSSHMIVRTQKESPILLE